MLPHPTLTFTIPSIHDDLPLECRVYHPSCIKPGSSLHRHGWRRNAAIVAHPYAPLGGCYDDPVVDIVGSTILSEGFLVGTFNFRGAGNSKGRTSWSSKAEQDDYLSFIGFMVYYIHHFAIPAAPNAPATEDLEGLDLTMDLTMDALSPIQSQVEHSTEPTHERSNCRRGELGRPLSNTDEEKTELHPACLLLAGYSYGAMILSSLPPLSNDVLAPFQAPKPSSSYEEIRLRARHLATQQVELVTTYLSSLAPSQSYPPKSPLYSNGPGLSSPKGHTSNLRVRVGGDENARRASHESHQSGGSFSFEPPEKIRRSLDRLRSISKPSRRHTRPSLDRIDTSQPAISSLGHFASPSAAVTLESPGKVARSIETCQPIEDILRYEKVAYLLISPLQGLIHNLATMWTSSLPYFPSSSSISASNPSVPNSTHISTSTSLSNSSLPASSLKLITHSTLAIYADDDGFVSIERLRKWARRLQDAASEMGREGGSAFRCHEASGAGHFWRGRDAAKELKEEVGLFVRVL